MQANVQPRSMPGALRRFKFFSPPHARNVQPNLTIK